MSTTPFRIAVDGGALVGERTGGEDGVLLLMVHGFGGSRGDWSAVTQALPAAISTLTFDQRGFGESYGEEGHAFSHAEDLAALLDALHIARVDLCGMSLGGATVLGCALAAPERVRRLVLVSPMLGGWSWSAEWVALWKEIGRAARNGNMIQARALWFDHPLFATVREGLHANLLQQQIGAFAGQQWVRDDQLPEPPMATRLSGIDVPTLLLTGGLDWPDFRIMAQRIEDALPEVRRIDDPTAGHMLTIERPVEIGAAISAFVA